MATSQQQQQEGSLNKVEKPVFVVLDQLKPGTRGRKVIAKVLTSNTAKQSKSRAVYHNVRHNRIAECLIGDDTATVLYTARNDQVDLLKPGTTVTLNIVEESLSLEELKLYQTRKAD